MAFPAAVAWLKMGGLRQTKRFERSASVDGHRFGDHAHMITALIEQRAAPGNEPMAALLKHWHPARPWPGRQAGELIGAVPGQGPEPLRQPQVG